LSSALGTTMAMSSKSSLPLSSNGELVIYDSDQSHLIEIEEDPKENVTPIPVPEPVLDVDTLRERFVVCRQRAVRSAGPPKSSYHPYSHCCATGYRSSSSTRRQICDCVEDVGKDQSEQGWGYGVEGQDGEGWSNGGLVDERWDGGGQQQRLGLGWK